MPTLYTLYHLLPRLLPALFLPASRSGGVGCLLLALTAIRPVSGHQPAAACRSWLPLCLLAACGVATGILPLAAGAARGGQKHGAHIRRLPVACSANIGGLSKPHGHCHSLPRAGGLQLVNMLHTITLLFWLNENVA